MSEDSNCNVINLPKPKSAGGSKKDVTWTVIYDPINGKWSWKVVHNPNPNIFSGTVDTQQDAYAAVDSIMKSLT